jgi:hypothetical protein
MASAASRQDRRARRARRAKKKQRKLVVDMRCDLVTGQMVCSATRVPHRTRLDYLADHDLLPELGAEGLGEDALRVLVAAAEESGSTDHWREALILLAHHRSELAKDVLAGLEDRVPPDVRDYWELAYAEAVGWLGCEFIRDADGVAHILPAGTIFGADDDRAKRPSC